MSDDDHTKCPSSFFKIIFEPRHDLEHLEIPIKFMKNEGKGLLDVVWLETPEGKKWEVKLVRDKKRAWLSNEGWANFVKYYSISHGHFLMFKYYGQAHINVYIFDKTACEIEYPFDLQDSKGKNRMKKMKVPYASLPRRKFRGSSHNFTKEDIKKINGCHFENPSFAVKMQPSYVNFKFNLNVPKNFAEEYLRGKHGSCIIENETGKIWAATCGGKKIYGGWKHFAIDNNLRVGDVCIFELIKKGDKAIFKVNTLN